MNDFFIGYNWPAPPGPMRIVRRAAFGLGAGAVGLSAILAVGHRPLEGGTFEFGHLTEHHGTIVEAPVPMLQPDDPREPWPLLAARGKHGAASLLHGFGGKAVTLKATRISRGAGRMLEIADASMDADQSSAKVATEPSPVSGDRAIVSLVGEIVDTKCYLGVMVPGEGTTHRSCAALCVRGGLPPALRVRATGGTDRLYLIAGSDATRQQAVEWAGETVEMSGAVTQQGGWLVLTTEPGAWQRR
jgi:hypothetical protein